MPLKPRSKRQAGNHRAFIAMSFTAPIEFDIPMKEVAAKLGYNRSQYITWLVQQDLTQAK
jgi:hypothetical protein